MVCSVPGQGDATGKPCSAASPRWELVVDDEFTTPTIQWPWRAKSKCLRSARLVCIMPPAAACSWYESAAAIFDELGIKANLVKAKSLEFQSGVRRPTYTVLDNRRAREAGLNIMPHWRDALKEYTAARRKAACTAV